MTDVSRAAAMAASVAKAAARVGVPPAAIEWLARVHAVAMTPRLRQLDDDHHPAYLHPGRSMLVLLRDVGVADPLTLACAAVLESRDPYLAIPEEDLVGLGGSLSEVVISLPLPGDEALAERLIMLSASARLATLAERLDHIRHEHLRVERDHWPELYAEVGAVWLPVAQRTDEKLAGRFAHWHRTFARRL